MNTNTSHSTGQRATGARACSHARLSNPALKKYHHPDCRKASAKAQQLPPRAARAKGYSAAPCLRGDQ
jgi:hypothetical protein